MLLTAINYTCFDRAISSTLCDESPLISDVFAVTCPIGQSWYDISNKLTSYLKTASN